MTAEDEAKKGEDMVKAEVAEDEGKATQSEGQASKRPRLVEGLVP